MSERSASPQDPGASSTGASPATGQPVWLRRTSAAISIVLCLFVLGAVNFNLLSQQAALALFGWLGIVLVIIHKPFAGKWLPTRVRLAIDLGLLAASAVSFGYILVQSDPLFQRFWVDEIMLGNRAGNETTLDYVLSSIGLIVVLDATRRAIGWTLPILCLLFFLYALFGPQMPDWLFPHAGLSWERIVQKTFLQSSGVFGVALRVMFMYVFLFVLFGSLLEQTGATGYVIDLARRMFQSSVGGPAKVAVVSSGLMGSLSGSAVANTATTGTFTIPLMKSAGFRPETAAGVEAAASSGGALVPPIMGAGAYMMLELVEPQVTYVQIIQAATIPAVLYYLALLLTVHYHAKKIGAATSNTSSTAEPADGDTTPPPETRDPHVYQGIVFFGSFVILIVMLVLGYTPFRAVTFGLGGVLLLSCLSSTTRIGPRKIADAMLSAGKGGMALIVAACCVGIILGIVNQTGIGVALPDRIQSLAGDSALAALGLLMVSTIVLGMGLPSAVCYLLMAILVGSVLTQLHTAPLAAHLFIFYFGMMSMVTPPVALAAYTAAAIAGADVMKSSFVAFRFSLVGFALPYAFVLQPELLMLTPDNEPAVWWKVLLSVLMTSLAIWGLATGIAGYAKNRLPKLVAWVLIAAALVVFLTRIDNQEFWIQLAALTVVAAILCWDYLRPLKNQPTD